jgi:hypothetical protein
MYENMKVTFEIFFLNRGLLSSKNGGWSFVAHEVKPLHFIWIDEVRWFLVYILG